MHKKLHLICIILARRGGTGNRKICKKLELPLNLIRGKSKKNEKIQKVTFKGTPKSKNVEKTKNPKNDQKTEGWRPLNRK